jgi:catechol 2,3-dioxygenase-like lactoylglutathione lyase family enzyme
MLLSGINHVAVLTGDTDRLVSFYSEVFDARSTTLQRTDGFRVTAIWLGASAELNVFEIADNDEHTHQVPMFGRGRLDHMALQVASLESFDEVRSRLLERNSTDGFVTDFGHMLSLFFCDPDGLECEVCVPNPDAQPDTFNPPGTPSSRYHPERTPPPPRVAERQLPGV